MDKFNIVQLLMAGLVGKRLMSLGWGMKNRKHGDWNEVVPEGLIIKHAYINDDATISILLEDEITNKTMWIAVGGDVFANS